MQNIENEELELELELIEEEEEYGDLYEWHEYKADPRQEPIRIDKYLMDRLKDVTRSKVQAGIEEGFVMVNGKVVKSNHKVKPHDVITVRLRRPRNDGRVMPENIPLDIRYEDDDVMIIYKPAGLVVHPGVGNHNGTLVNALAWHFKGLPIVEGTNEYPGVVHRIDKDTTGLMVVAKTDNAISKLAKQFFEHTIQRRYRALVWGDFDEEEGTVDEYIGRHERNAKMFAVYEDGSHGKHAVTHYKVIKRYGYVTLIECRLETGRTHQIRVHMKHIGHPLFNDKLYGGDKIVKGTIYTKYKEFVDNAFKMLPHQALHAFSLGFVHPTTGEDKYFEAPLPEYFQATLDKWEKYTEGRLRK
jgi:23S rRNA pseudouridine1911/1915/1917 synthase